MDPIIGVTEGTYTFDAFRMVNGEIVEIPPEELEQYTSDPSPDPPTPEDRLAALEAAMLDLILGGGVDG